MSRTKIIFRADGNSQIGLGHVVRSLALAEMLREEFDCVFAIQEPIEALVNQIRTICQEIIILPQIPKNKLESEAEEFLNILHGKEILVLDGYHFSTGYQRIITQKKNILVCIDDLHDRKFLADAIINIAGNVKSEDYRALPGTKYFLGPAYTPLRKPFREVQKERNKSDSKVSKVLICFGGADPDNYTLQMVNELKELDPEMHLEIVTGSAFKHIDSLQSIITEKRYVNWHKNLNAEEMAMLMAHCSVAVSSASSVAYEYCAVNGMLFVEKTVENQNDLYHFLIAEGLALPITKLNDCLSAKTLWLAAEKLIEKQKEIFDGQTEVRYRKIFHQLALQANLSFRKVNEADSQLLFDWANDPVVRKFSFNPDPIPFETHITWLNNKLRDPDALLLLAEIDGEAAALLRFDLDHGSALISYQIGAAFRGKGLGHRVLQLGLRELKNYFPEVTQAIGYVQPVNVPSVRAFEKAEFVNMGLDEANNAFKFTKAV